MNKKYPIRGLTLAVCLLAFEASAQTDIETIVVSATRSNDETLGSPSNVAALSSAQLERTQAEHIQQALSQIPGVSLQRGDGQESLPGVRSAVLTGAGACGNVLVMEEGIPVRGPAFCNVNELFDTHFEQARQIDVTRGPSTAFYGSNALLGSINVSLPSNVKNAIALELGEENYRRFKGTLAYSGQSDRAVDGDINGALYLTLTDTDSFREEASYQQQKLSWRHAQSLGEWQLNAGATLSALDQETAGFLLGEDSYLDRALAQQNPNPEAFRKTESLRAWAKLSRQTRAGNTIQFTPYVRATDMDFLLHFLPGDPLEQNKQSGFGWQSSLRGQANQNLNWAVGFDADFSDGELRQTQASETQGSAFLRATVPAGVQYDYQVDAQQLGLFGHLQWQPSEQFQLLAGARLERLNYDYDNRALTGRSRDDGTNCGFGGCRYSRPADRKDSFDNLSPKIELRYQVSDQTSLFAIASSAFRAPQATELYRLQRAQQVADLDNVKAENFELGFAYRTPNTKLTMSAYRLEQENVIIRDSDFFNTDGNNLSSQGLELALRQRLFEKLDWRLTGTFADHRYASEQFSGGVDINGNKVDTAPSRLINTAFSWQPTERMNTEVELQHVSSYFLEPENQRTYPGHTVANLRARYQVSDKLSFSARVLNLTDKRYAERADFTGFTGERYFPGAPRTLFLGIKYRFSSIK